MLSNQNGMAEREGGKIIKIQWRWVYIFKTITRSPTARNVTGFICIISCGRKEWEKGKGRRKRKEGSLSEQLFGWLACDEALLWAITGGTCGQADPLCCALEPWPGEHVALAQETWGHAKALCTCMSQCEAPSEGSGKNALIKLVNAIRQELSSNPLKY